MEFSDVEPDDSCACGGCADRRRIRLHAVRSPRRRPLGARRAAVLIAAAGSVLGGSAVSLAAAAPRTDSSPLIPDTPQGEVAGPYGADAGALRSAAPRPATTRAEIMRRAQTWVDQKVPYSMSKYWSDGYRQDCSGFVSMAWGLGSSQTTWTLPDFADRISKDDLQPGDALVYNNPKDPEGGSHTVLFGGWVDAARTTYTALEQTRPGTTKRSTPYAYWSNASGYLPYRYRGLSQPVPAPEDSDAFPGADEFGPGKVNPYVTRLGKMLVERGGGRFYREGPGPDWGEADRKATEAFQLAQGWRGAEADGYPGKDTWDLLVHHKGNDIPPVVTAPTRPPTPTVPTTPTPTPTTPTTPPPGTPSPPPPGQAPPFPGADRFGPGKVNDDVLLLGQRLVAKGFGAAYREGPDRSWGEADRLNTAAFQRAQGWSGAEADGYPGPHTWQLLFS
ncbi:peptidoglycan-binding protein [Kitasatospora phosalacinea]|uniref:peptidoglycan-binding protein n=1 Tax=Kitasatospora phosalacinea TaxID=2065 RepID=UPI000524D65D|nr:peptidoglycan-binding protein [Kitasatospora phosalacinea]